MPRIITDFLFPDILELFSLVSWLICFSVELGVTFFFGDISWFCRVTSFPLSLSLFSIFSWLSDELVGSTSCEISFSLLLLLLMFVSESFSLFLSPVSSVLLLFAVVIIFSVSFDFALSLDFTLCKFVSSWLSVFRFWKR